jgi:hypothetical protein
VLAGACLCGGGVLAAFGGTGATASTSTFPTPTVPQTTIGTIPATTSAPSTTAATTTTPGTTPPPTTSGPNGPGKSVRLRPRTKASGCRVGILPDRRCSPGALYTGLTRAVVCSPSFDPAGLDDGTAAKRAQIVAEYGLAHARALELDRIVPAVLGGSNDVANLWPERAPGYRLKDRLETRLRGLVCAGAIELHAAQVALAANWAKMYARVFGSRPNL